MSEEIFHPFPRLPTELRLEIWRLAVRPQDGYHGGVQYFTWTCGAPTPITYFGTRRRLHPTAELPEKECRSAFRWDIGLFGACRESNKVVSKKPVVENTACGCLNDTGSQIPPVGLPNIDSFLVGQTIGLACSRPRLRRAELARIGKPKWDVLYEPDQDLSAHITA